VVGRRSARKYGRVLNLRPDLGIKQLLPEWRAMLSPVHLREDTVAGLTVACVAIPLSLAIALASEVEPAVGLVTAIVAGIVCALFGGTPLSVSGPAAAMAVLIGANVEKFGVGGLLIIGLGTGLLQLLSGITGFGRLARYVPTPVIAGFTAGIGVIILVGQLPRALGLPPPDQNHVIDVITHLGELFHELNPRVLGLTLLTILITKGLPKWKPKLPAPLIAVALPTIIVAVAGIDVPLIGEIPRSLPTPSLPVLPKEGWGELITATIIVFSLASLETLLSSSAVDKLSRGKKHDPDQELVGQGVGNVVVSLFGGIPVTGVIARSALNVRSGAKTRRASIIHSLVLLLVVFALAPVISQIPIAALAGVLLAIAMNMLNREEFMQVWKASRVETIVYTVTFLTIVFVDLIVGVQAGMVVALLIAVIRMGQTRVLMPRFNAEGPYRLSFGGPLSFLSYHRVEKLKKNLSKFGPSQGLIIDMSDIVDIDTTGAEMLLDLLSAVRAQGANFALKGLARPLQRTLLAYDHADLLKGAFAETEAEVDRIMYGQDEQNYNKRDKLIFGVDRFRKEHRPRYEALFEKLATSQEPHTLFITCSDSRISPNLITTTDPGELFIVRNVGNVIPVDGTDATPAEGAAIEFAVSFLGVENIVICGHSGCGAVKASLSDNTFKDQPNLAKWIAQMRNDLVPQSAGLSIDEVAKLNVIKQMEHAKSYPVIRTALAEGKLRIHAWFYDVGLAEFYEYSAIRNRFVLLGEETV